MRDGQQVSYVGPTGPGFPAVGDQGKVLSSSGNSGHVQWATGARRRQVDLVIADDVVEVRRERQANRVEAAFADSLEVGEQDEPLQVRAVLEESGEVGLLNALAASGHLAGLQQIAEEALEFVAARVRQDPHLATVLGHLDQGEGDSLVSLASSVLLRDAFTPED